MHDQGYTQFIIVLVVCLSVFPVVALWGPISDWIRFRRAKPEDQPAPAAQRLVQQAVAANYFTEDQTPFARLTKRKKLNVALENSWAVTLRYVDRDDTETTRKVLPLDIEGQVLTAHCFLRKDERHFRLDRIQAIHIHSGVEVDEDELEDSED